MEIVLLKQNSEVACKIKIESIEYINASIGEVQILGTIASNNFTDMEKELFNEFDEIVNNQVFSLLDEISDRISALKYYTLEQTGKPIPIFDLQIYNDGGAALKMIAGVEWSKTLFQEQSGQ